MFCCCCRAINGCNLNVSARRTQQSNHSLTSIMKHPLLSSLSQSLYSITFTCWHPAKHNPCSQHSGVQGLKVTWHHWPSSIWTLLCYTTLTLAVFREKKKMWPKTKIAPSLSAALKLNHRTIAACTRRFWASPARHSSFSLITVTSSFPEVSTETQRFTEACHCTPFQALTSTF